MATEATPLASSRLPSRNSPGYRTTGAERQWLKKPFHRALSSSGIRNSARRVGKIGGCTAPLRCDFHWSALRSALFCSVPLLPRSASPAWEAEPMGVAVSLETVASGFFPRPLPPHATSRAGPRIRGLLAAATLQKSRSLWSSAPLRPFGFKGAGRAQNGPLSQGMVPGESNTEIRQCLQSDWLPS